MGNLFNFEPDKLKVTEKYEREGVQKTISNWRDHINKRLGQMEARLQTLGIGEKSKVSSETKSVLKLMIDNHNKYLDVWPPMATIGKPSKDFKKAAEVVELMEKDKSQIEKKINELEKKYESKDKKPDVIQEENKQEIKKYLQRLLGYTGSCAKILKDEIKNYKNSQNKELEKLFDKKNIGEFVKSFLDNKTVKEYIGKSISETGRMLKHIQKPVLNCKNVLSKLDEKLKEYLWSATLKNGELGFDNGRSVKDFDDYCEANRQNLNSWSKQVDKLSDYCKELSDVLNRVIQRAKKNEKVIALYKGNVASQVMSFKEDKVDPSIKVCREMRDALFNNSQGF